MLRTFFKNTYWKISLCRFYSRLDSIDQLYSNGNEDEYFERMKVFNSDLAQFVDGYVNSFPNISIGSIYSDESALSAKIENMIADRRVNELHDLSNLIKLFLDKLYDAVFTSRKNRIRAFSYVVLIFLIFLFAVSYIPLKKRYQNERDEYKLVANKDIFKKKTIEDIFALKQALNKYYTTTKSYPKSSGGWDAIHAAYGQSREDWIPGLAPGYIKELPVDPRKSDDPIKQYMYKSDGTDYKLIAHFPAGIDEIINEYPQYVDPRRPSWAFGVWTEGAKNW